MWGCGLGSTMIERDLVPERKAQEIKQHILKGPKPHPSGTIQAYSYLLRY